MGIECDQTKVGLIGSFDNFGLTVGSLLFSVIMKYLTYKPEIIIFVFVYVVFIFLTIIIDSFAFNYFVFVIVWPIWVLWL